MRRHSDIPDRRMDDRDRRDRDRDRGRERESERDFKRRRSPSPPRRYSPTPKRPAYDAPRGQQYPPDDHPPRSDAGAYDRRRTNGSPPPTFLPRPPPRRSSESLMSYKQFMLELDDDVSPAEAQRRYEEYKSSFITNRKKAYFDEHGQEDWLRDKYDPQRLEALLDKRAEHAQSASKRILSDLQAGALDPSPSANPRNRLREEEDPAPKVPYAAGRLSRAAVDIDRCLALIAKLDKEKGVAADNFLLRDHPASSSDNIKVLIPSSEGEYRGRGGRGSQQYLEGLDLLDALLTYLWRVHALDYYGGAELVGLPEGLRHVRDRRGKVREGESEREAADREGRELEDWARSLDEVWKKRLGPEGVDPVVRLVAKEPIEAKLADALEAFVRKIQDEKFGWKYGCGAKGCTKLFHGPEFVHKHLKLKHPELVGEEVAKLKQLQYRENYLSDPNAPYSSSNSNSAPPAAVSPRDVPPPPRSHSRPDSYPSRHEDPRAAEDPERDARRGRPYESEVPRQAADRYSERGPPRPPAEDKPRYGAREEEETFDKRGGRAAPWNGEERDRRRGEDDRYHEGAGYGGVAGYRGAPPPMHVAHQALPPPPLPPVMYDERGMPIDSAPPLEAPPPVFDPYETAAPPPPTLRPAPNVGPIPPVLVPLPGAGPLGPFAAAPPDVTARVLREHNFRPPAPAIFDAYDAPPHFDVAPAEIPHPDALEEPMGRSAPAAGGRGVSSRLTGRLGKPNRGGDGYGAYGAGRGSMPMFPVFGHTPVDPRGVRSYRDLDAPDDEVTVVDYRNL